MTATAKLAEIDRMFGQAGGVYVVSELALQESGVDPIGLRQLNLNLMDRVAPGINNVTHLIRPYAFMAWAWSRARDVASARGSQKAQSKVLRDLVDRYECLYAWSHMLAGATGLRGYTGLRRVLPLNGSDATFEFKGEAWEALKRERASASIMAAVEYGPSIKAMRWLKAVEDGTFAPTTEAAAAIAAIDHIVQQHCDSRLFELDPGGVAPEAVEPLQRELLVTEVTEAEKACFRTLFYELGNDPASPPSFARRRQMLETVREALRRHNRPLAAPEIRRVFAGGRLTTEPQHRLTATYLCALQVRQLQRLALEAMLVWIETVLCADRGVQTDELVARARIEADTADSATAYPTLGDCLSDVAGRGDAMGWPRAAGVDSGGVLDLIADLGVAQRQAKSAIPMLVLRSLAVIHAVVRSFPAEPPGPGQLNPFGGGSDRLPLASLCEGLDRLAARPIEEFWREVIERWVIGQHVRWSSIRGGDGKKRLRIALDAAGWIPLRDRASGPFGPTPDRLATFLSLSAASGLLIETMLNGERLYSVPD